MNLDAPFGGLVETALGAFDYSVLQSCPQLEDFIVTEGHGSGMWVTFGILLGGMWEPLPKLWFLRRNVAWVVGGEAVLIIVSCGGEALQSRRRGCEFLEARDLNQYLCTV